MTLKIYIIYIFLFVNSSYQISVVASEGASNNGDSTVKTQEGLNTSNTSRDLRQKWRNQLVSDAYDEANPNVTTYIRQLSKKAEILYENLNKGINRTHLWSPVHGNTNPADLTVQFTKLQTLTLAYGTNGTKYYRDPNILSAVESGLEFMVTVKKYNGKIYYGNWWHWQVGVAEKFTEILMIIYDELSQEKRQQYTNIIKGYVPNTHRLLYYRLGDEKTNDITFVPTNCRIGLAKTVLALGILQNNYRQIEEASDCVTNVIRLMVNKKVSRGESNLTYDKGSFRTFDYNVVYNIGQILYIIQDLRFKIDPEIAESFADHVTEVFLPLIYGGELVPPVMGRAITRWNNGAPLTSYNLLLISKYASPKTKKNIENAVKHWALNQPNYINGPRDYKDLTLITSLVQDDSVTGDKMPFSGTKMYATLDRFVQRTPSYMFVLSMYSDRGLTHDSLHRENKRGWHTSDGMIYLYNDDDVQFRETYWPTVDAYRLPGTTVDTIPLENAGRFDPPKPTHEDWVGGVANNNQAVIGMSLNKRNKREDYAFSMNLRAKKSWFVVDGQIVALGAGITGDSRASIETVVDNRLLNDRYNYNVSTNHGSVAANGNQTDVDWLILDSNQPASIGYYFPNKEAIDIISETRLGSYRDINEAFPDDVIYTGNYKKFLINHGQNPFKAKYAYVILPGINKTKLINYHKNRPVTILENSANIQAVEIKEHNYLGVNIWSETGGTIAGIASDKPVSLMKQSNNNQDTYVLSDPTQKKSIVTIKIPDFIELVELSEGVTFDIEKYVFEVNFRNAAGGSKQFTVKNEVITPHSINNDNDFYITINNDK